MPDSGRGSLRSGQRIVLRLLLLVICLNASVMLGLHEAQHLENQLSALTAQSPADDDTPDKGYCSLCLALAQQIAPGTHDTALPLLPGSSVLPLRDAPALHSARLDGLRSARAPPRAA